MSATRIIDVLSTKDARLFVSKVNVVYGNNSLKDIIFDPKYDDDYLLITKRIGSSPIWIDDVKVIDDALIDSLLRYRNGEKARGNQTLGEEGANGRGT